MRLPYLFIALVIGLFCSMDADAAGRRVALVVGNADYNHAPRLAAPVNDAEDIAATLAALGFDVDLQVNVPLEALRTRLRSFTAKSAEADISIFYFSGYSAAAGVGGYLIPVDAALATPASAAAETIPLPSAIAGAAQARQLGLVILDAMRDNPFPASPGSRGSGDAGAAGASIRNTLVFFPTEPGRLAEEGAGRNSPFAAALIKYLPEPDLEINFLFRHVRDHVRDSTMQRQTPYMYGQLSRNRIYLNPVQQAALGEPDPALARRCNSLAAALGDIWGGSSDLANRQDDGRTAEAVAACTEAVKRSPSVDQLHYQLGRSLFASGDLSGAAASYKAASELGNARALYELGWMYDSGSGVEKDDARARFYYEMAAEKNVAPALVRLGLQQERGLGNAGDPSKAYALYQRAAQLGDPVAINRLGELTEKGLGTRQNLKQARTFYERGAALGLPEAMINLARCNANGIGGRQDIPEAKRLLARAADAGSAEARRILSGIGRPRSN